VDGSRWPWIGAPKTADVLFETSMLRILALLEGPVPARATLARPRCIFSELWFHLVLAGAAIPQRCKKDSIRWAFLPVFCRRDRRSGGVRQSSHFVRSGAEPLFRVGARLRRTGLSYNPGLRRWGIHCLLFRSHSSAGPSRAESLGEAAPFLASSPQPARRAVTLTSTFRASGDRKADVDVRVIGPRSVTASRPPKSRRRSGAFTCLAGHDVCQPDL